MLSKEEIEHGVRLACQHEFNKDTTIYIPASSFSEEQKLQIIGQERDIKVEPIVNKYYLKLERATLKDVKADFNRIIDSLKSTYNITANSIDFHVLAEMPTILRENKWEVTVSVRNKEIILLEGKDTTDKIMVLQ